MKKVFKTVLGVTLLEVMLVLAIAAMIIVMSVRYYQSASSSQQANSVLQQVQAIVAAANQLAQATGSYSAASVNSTTLGPLLPGGWNKTPWGEDIEIASVASNKINMNIKGVPSGVCPLFVSKLATDNHFYSSSAGDLKTSLCGATATDLPLVYIQNP